MKRITYTLMTTLFISALSAPNALALRPELRSSEVESPPQTERIQKKPTVQTGQQIDMETTTPKTKPQPTSQDQQSKPDEDLFQYFQDMLRQKYGAGG